MFSTNFDNIVSYDIKDIAKLLQCMKREIQKFVKKTGLLVCLFISFSLHSFAQQEEQNSLYMFNVLNFNPAYAGSRGSLNVTAIGRFQWVGISGAPMTQFLSIHAPIAKQNIGLGVNLVNDIIGSRNRTSVYADFAYSIRLNRKNHRLAFGINGGVDIWQMNPGSMVINDPTDPAAANFSKVVGNFGGGLYYYGQKHYIGFSVPRILENDLNNPAVAGNSRSARHFYIMGGYVFNLNSVVKFKPGTLIKITPNAPLTFDLNASFLLYEKIWAGAMWRFNESAGFNISYTFADMFTIGYAFDFAYNDLRFNQYGSHEVMLQVDLRKKQKNYLSPRYFSYF
jgi:type IX secretion system PorP/SprF family membrane protein